MSARRIPHVTRSRPRATKVPSERVPNLREHDEDEITDALASLMTTDGLFDDVEETLREARRKELEERRAKIQAELKELSDA